MTKLYWKIYYMLNPVKGLGKSRMLIAYARCNGVRYIDMKISRE